MLMDIILYLLQLCNYLYQQNLCLISIICRYIPLRQWAFDDSHSPKYQKFKVDRLPVIQPYAQDWDYKDLIHYYYMRYDKYVFPVRRKKPCDIPTSCSCPRCKAPFVYLYRNNGKKGQLLCKVCDARFSPEEGNRFSSLNLRCPYCEHSLVQIKDRKHFVIHKCINLKCSYYLNNLKKVDKADLKEENGKSKYKLHYIYREFMFDFFKMDITTLPKNASSLKFTKHSAHIMSLCLTYRVNLGLSLRKTAQAMKDIHGVSISHQMVANYCKTAAVCIKPAVIGYQVSDNRGVGPCIMAMRMAFQHLEKLPENFRFIADGYSAYPLAAQQFFVKFGEKMKFSITQVIGLTNDDAVSAEFRPYKQLIERLNRTYKASYRPTNGFDNYEGANYDLALWVAYYNFLRPHRVHRFQPPVRDEMIMNGENMPGKWQLMIYMGQKVILNLQEQKLSACENAL